MVAPELLQSQHLPTIRKKEKEKGFQIWQQLSPRMHLSCFVNTKSMVTVCLDPSAGNFTILTPVLTSTAS